MQQLRPMFAQHPTRFGRAPVRDLGGDVGGQSTLAADVRLFAVTFLAGFLFVSILIA